MSSKTAAGSSAASGGFPLGTLSLIFWCVVHWAVPLGTTWGGASAHEIAYIVLLLGLFLPLAVILVVVVLVVLVAIFS